jgi:hypothetical protein
MLGTFRPRLRLLHWWFRRRKKKHPVIPPAVTETIVDEKGNALSDESANFIVYS